MTMEKAIKELTQLLHEDFLSEYSETIRTAIKALEQEPKMGKWNFTKHYGRDYYVCSFCGMERMDDHSSGWNYCPNCGSYNGGEAE